MKRLWRDLKIGTKLNVIVILLLLAFSLVINLVVQNQVSSGIKETAVQKASSDLELGFLALNQQYPGPWEIKGGELYKGDVRVNGNLEMVDLIGDLTEGTVTIFQGDTRVTTNVVDSTTGQRAINTQASEQVIQTVLGEGRNFYGEADVAGTMSQTAYQPIRNGNGEIVGMWYVGASQEMIDDTVSAINKVLLGALTVGLVITVFIVVMFTKRLALRLNNVSYALEKAGEGDFRETIADNSYDEVGSLSRSYNHMRDNLKGLIQSVMQASEQVASSSQQLTASAEETNSATDQIAESIQSIASGSENQVSSSTGAHDSATQISNGIEQISTTISDVSETTDITKEKSDSGKRVIQKSIDQMELINEKTNEISNVIGGLGDKSQEIGKILALITNVSEQTNLLALNAAIEAARAGEHGKGFTVVADEVKKLAEQSNHSASQIHHLIKDIQQDIDLSVTSMSAGKSSVHDGIELVNEAGEEFENISSSINDMTTQVSKVSAAIQQINDETDSMVTSINEAATSAKDSAGYTQNVAASAEEQHASMEEITSAAMTLSHMAEELRVSVDKFKL